MNTRTLLRRLSFLAATALAVPLLQPAGSRLLARPPDAGDLLALTGQEATTSGAPSAVLVFQIVDCAESRVDLAGWWKAMTASALASPLASPAPVVVGVLVGPVPEDRSETRRILDEAGLDFPVRRDRSGRVARFVHALGYRKTPVALLLDARGRLERAGTPGSFVALDATAPVTGSMSDTHPTTEAPS